MTADSSNLPRTFVPSIKITSPGATMSEEGDRQSASHTAKKQKIRDVIVTNTHFSVAYTLSWSLRHAIRELLANCTDEDPNTAVAVDEGRRVITMTNIIDANSTRRSRLGITRDSLAYKPDDKAKDVAKSGKFGYGLKDAIAVLFAHGVKWKAISRAGTFESMFEGENTSEYVEISFSDEPQQTSTTQELCLVDVDLLSPALLHSREWLPMELRWKELKQALTEAKSQCVHFTEVLAGSSVLTCKDKRGVVIAAAHIFGDEHYRTSSLHGGFYAHNVYYPWSDQSKRKFLFSYNLHMAKTELRSRDRDAPPLNWSTCIANYIVGLTGEDQRRIMSILDMAERCRSTELIYELDIDRIRTARSAYKTTLDRDAATRRVAVQTRIKCAERVQVTQLHLSELIRRQESNEESVTVSRTDIIQAKSAAHQAQQNFVAQEQVLVEMGCTDVDEAVPVPQEKVWIYQSDSERKRAHAVASDSNIDLSVVATLQDARVSENASFSEYEVLQTLGEGMDNFPVVRATQRVLSILGLKSQFSISSMSSFESDMRGRRVFCGRGAVSVAFGKVCPSSADDLRALEEELLVAIAQAPLLNLQNKSQISAITGIATEIIRLVPGKLEYKNQQASVLGPVIPVRFRPLLIVNAWDTEEGGLSAFNMQLANGLARMGVEVFVVIAGQVSEAEVAKWPNDGKIRVFDCYLHRHKWVPVMKGYEAAVTHMIGHAHVTGKEAAQIAALPQFSHAKLWQFNHIIPLNVDLLKSGVLTTNVDKARNKEKLLKELNSKADFVWSVGPMMFEHFHSPDLDGRHAQILLPLNPFFTPRESSAPPGKKLLEGNTTFRVLFVGRCEDQYVKGLDIAYNACVRAGEILTDRGVDTRKVKLVIRGIPSSDVQQITQNCPRTGLIETLGFGSPADVLEDLRRCHLFIMPSRSEPFGLVATEAIATALPVLVSNNSGVAEMLARVDMGVAPSCSEIEIVVTSSASPAYAPAAHAEADTQTWGKAIADAVQNYDKRVRRAALLRTAVATHIDNTHPYQSFVNQGCAELGLPPQFAIAYKV